MATSTAGMSAMQDLGMGLGDVLDEQRRKTIEDEQRKKRIGMSSIGMNPLNFGMTGVAAADLGFAGGR